MNAKLYLFGVFGGILCTLLLWYPLTTYLPSLWVSDWPAANASMAWGLLALACASVLGSGAAAAQWSGTRSRLGASISGGIAGWVAFLIAYILLIGAAASLRGAVPILSHGLISAASEAQFIALLVDSVGGVHWWTMLVLWVGMFASLGLGALGGLVAGPGGEPDPDMDLIYQILGVTVVLTACLMILVTTITFGLLGEALTDSSLKYNLTPAYPPDAVLACPITSLFLFMFDGMLIWWFFYQKARKAGQAVNLHMRMSALVFLIAPAITLVLAFLVYSRSIFYTLYLPFFAAALLAAGLIMWKVWPEGVSGQANSLSTRVAILSILLSLLILGAGAYLAVVPAALGDVSLVVTALPAIMPDEGPVEIPTLVGLVSQHFGLYLGSGLFAMLVAMPLLTMLAGGITFFILRRAGLVLQAD